jgi:hypothetical protein
VCWVFMRFEPLSGWREVALTERRRKQEEFAHRMLRRLVEEHYPQAEKIRIVLDNLSTHSGAAFYENYFSAGVARKLAQRTESFCYTPVHGSHGCEHHGGGG